MGLYVVKENFGRKIRMLKSKRINRVAFGRARLFQNVNDLSLETGK